MSERDDSRPEGLEEDSSPEGFEDTVVEILSLGDEEDATDASSERSRDAATEGDPRVGSVEMRRLESVLAMERERSLRLRADFDNYRKRTERERADIERFALADALRDLLPVVDNLERALGAQGGQGDSVDLRRGVEMIVRQLHEILKRYGLSPIPAVGERFDPAVHEAVFQEESDVVAAPTVAAELQRGYRLNDRLLRPSLVKVAVPREMADDDSSSDSSQ
jgi:molecular chaperone GrpE